VARHDVLVVGGGLVGASLARALEGLDLDVAVVEAAPPPAGAAPPGDGRVIALGWGSRVILEGLGIWASVAPEACPIRGIRVSDRGWPAGVRLEAEDEGLPALGYVVGAAALGAALGDALRAAPATRLYAPARVVALEAGADQVLCTLVGEEVPATVSARLVVGADGNDSRVRTLAGIGVREHDYRQSAVLATVRTARHHDHVAYERFTRSGPLALLPLADGRSSVVWTVRAGMEDRVAGLGRRELLAALQERFGWRLGRFEEAAGRGVYPLRRRLARCLTAPRVALAGNAAHALHPVAGQGLNLGLRDVAALADMLAEASRGGLDPGAPEALARYRALRRGDQLRVSAATDLLVRLFGLRLPPAGLARALGMAALDQLPPLRHGLARHAMGLGGRLPALARGARP
jgi:2-octaprenyl-6-methoxyphenol hydroxylase